VEFPLAGLLFFHFKLIIKNVFAIYENRFMSSPFIIILPSGNFKAILNYFFKEFKFNVEFPLAGLL